MFGNRSALVLVAGTATALALSAIPAVAQDSFTCPTPTPVTTNQTVIQLALPSGDAFHDPDALVQAVTELHADGVSLAETVHSLIAAYCPVVASDTNLSDTQKTQEVQRFATRITSVVYGLDSANEILLNVPFPPVIMDSIAQKARQAGVRPEEWVRDVVELALD